MIKDDKQRVIGKLVGINSDKFIVELLNHSINFTVSGFEDIYQYAQINGYVVLPYQDFYIVCEIFGIREKDNTNHLQGEKDQILNKSNTVKYIDINPIGTIVNSKFKFGVSIFPTLYTDVLYIKKDELDIIFDLKNEIENIDDSPQKSRLKLLDVGTSTIFPDYKVKIDINGFFGSHSAILGNTGSGKSCTISSMLQTLLSKEEYSAIGSSFLFFDVNGEYHKAFSQLKNKEIEVNYFSINDINSNESFTYSDEITRDFNYYEFKLPHWFLNIDEWALLLQASERTQLPILRSALGFSQNITEKSRNHIYATNILYVFENWESPVAKRQRIISLIEKADFDNIDVSGYNSIYGNMSNVDEENFKESIKSYIDLSDFEIPVYQNEFFSFNSLEDNIEDAILYEEYHGNKQIRDYCSSLITRFKSLKGRDEFNFLKKCNSSSKSDEFLDVLLGKKNNSKKSQVTIIDLNSIEDEIVEVISCVITRMIFEKLRSLDERNTFPVNLILEEAHRYISEYNNSSFGEANKVFERVAKEGRKYGVFLTVSSQRPSELSKTVLSQCSNFIVHRIQNPDDLSYIRQMTPHISNNILSRLPSIPRQHALVFGNSVQIPTLFKVNDSDPTPNSSDSDISKYWFVPKPESND